jgi:hypothetical protein
MKDLRCILGWHHWVRRQIEDSQYQECSRCGRDRPAPHRPPTGATGI